jgi:hypothetical protein
MAAVNAAIAPSSRRAAALRHIGIAHSEVRSAGIHPDESQHEALSRPTS